MAVGTLTTFLGMCFPVGAGARGRWAYLIAAGLRDRSVLPAVAGLQSPATRADGGHAAQAWPP